MIKAALIDLSGVLYVGSSALPGAHEALELLYQADIPTRFVTNSTRNPKRRLLEQLERLGFAITADQLLTPAQAACDWLAAEGMSPHLLVHPDLKEDFDSCHSGMPKAVVVGDAGTFFTFEALNEAFRVLITGAPFLALAANRVFMDSDNALSMDVGAFVKALEYASGSEAVVLGKPAPAFFAAAAASLGCELSEIVMIGDDAEADVAGALAAGIGAGVLVRTGKYCVGDENKVEPRPSAVVDGVREAVDWVLAD